MRNMPSREECLALAGRVLSVPAHSAQDLGHDVFAEHGTGKRNKDTAIVVNAKHREIIAQALIFWSQHHA